MVRIRELRAAMTPAESALWERLNRNALGVHFRRQQALDGFITDFYCHRAGLVVEVDVSVHDDQVDYDQARDDVLRGEGLVDLRFTNDDVLTALDSVLERIAEVINQRLQSLRSE